MYVKDWRLVVGGAGAAVARAPLLLFMSACGTNIIVLHTYARAVHLPPFVEFKIPLVPPPASGACLLSFLLCTSYTRIV